MLQIKKGKGRPDILVRVGMIPTKITGGKRLGKKKNTRNLKGKEAAAVPGREERGGFLNKPP